MVGRRIVYGVALLAALALQIFYDGYLAQFLLICVIALPLLSLALSLRGVIGVHLELTPSASQLVQGESGQWQIAAHTRSFLPVARLTMVVTLENRLTGDRQRQRLKTSGLSRGMARTLPMDTSHCGQLTCQLHRVRALDLLGLFAFPVSTPALVHALVLPQPAPTEDLPPLPQMPAGDSLKWRGTPSMEDYDLREYRPGDPLRSIHWKLSSKHDSLVVREPVKTGLPQAGGAGACENRPASGCGHRGPVWRRGPPGPGAGPSVDGLCVPAGAGDSPHHCVDGPEPGPAAGSGGLSGPVPSRHG